tara:strand:- start:683 stop:1537 length:855 start_codon:yes stop_codon:yes gene_type:complete
MSILEDQNIASGMTISSTMAGGAAELSFSTREVGDTVPVASLTNANHAADSAQAEALGLNPQPNTGVAENKKKTGGIDIYKLADFMGQYGPAGFNMLGPSQMTMLTAYANAVADGRVGSGGATNMISSLMKRMATSSAARSASIVEEQEGSLGNASGSGGHRSGFGTDNPYAGGAPSSLPSVVGFEPILKDTIQDTQPPPMPAGEAAFLASAEGTEHIMSTHQTEVVVPEKEAEALLTSDGAQTIDPMADRLTPGVRKFLSSAGNRAAAGAYMAQFTSTRRTRG